MNKHLIYTLCLEVFFHLFFFKQRTWKYFVNDSYLLRIYKPKRRRRRPLVWGAGHSLPYPISSEGAQWGRSCEYHNELKTGSECQFSQLLLSRRPLTKAASKKGKEKVFFHPPAIHLPLLLPCQNPTGSKLERRNGVSKASASMLENGGACLQLRNRSLISGMIFIPCLLEWEALIYFLFIFEATQIIKNKISCLLATRQTFLEWLKEC